MTEDEILQATRPYHDLWNYQPFQTWLKDSERDLAELKEFTWSVTHASSEKMKHAVILEKLGLEPPVTDEDHQKIFLHLRTVVNFWRRKLGQLKSQSDRYDEVEKQLNARAANGDLGRPRIVAR